VRILGLSGSLRAGSHNAALLRAAAGALPPGTELVLWAADDLRALPHFDEDLEASPPPPVAALRDAVEAADAVLVATPEYNGSLPGVLKNALDWLSRPYATNVLRNRPAAVVGASTGMFGAVWAQADARRVLAHVGARVLDTELPVGVADEAFAPDGRLADPQQRAALADLLADLLAAAGAHCALAA